MQMAEVYVKVWAKNFPMRPVPIHLLGPIYGYVAINGKLNVVRSALSHRMGKKQNRLGLVYRKIYNFFR